MKKITFTLISMTVASVFITSCNSNPSKDLIVRKWKVASMKINDEDQQVRMVQQKAAIDTIKDSLQKVQYKSEVAQMEGLLQSTTEFKNDGAYESTMPTNKSGNWELTGEGKKLVFTLGEKKQDGTFEKDTARIDELSKEKLAITFPGMFTASFVFVPAQ